MSPSSELGVTDCHLYVGRGVALPEWIFSQDRRAAPWILIALVFFCILLPLVGAALFLLRTNKFVGSNQVAQQTIEIFARCGIITAMACRW